MLRLELHVSVLLWVDGVYSSVFFVGQRTHFFCNFVVELYFYTDVTSNSDLCCFSSCLSLCICSI